MKFKKINFHKMKIIKINSKIIMKINKIYSKIMTISKFKILKIKFNKYYLKKMKKYFV